MQPLIKWPGGKTSELEILKKHLPEYSGRYMEPFFGGGALFFDLAPENAVINDISKNLMSLYRFIGEGNEKFRRCVYGISEEWSLIKEYCGEKTDYFSAVYRSFRDAEITEEELLNRFGEYTKTAVEFIAGKSQVISDKETFANELFRMVSDKLLRTAKNEEKFGALSDDDLKSNILTGFTAGYYMYMRTMFNAMEKDKFLFISDEYRIAVFFFVREFCYGSMFRYNKNGDFNIPYGGIAYNSKDFKKKADALFYPDTVKILSSAEVYSIDFENIFKMAKKEDFLFLDPPYDTDFSDYETNAFGKEEHKRLAKCIAETEAKFLLIIKNTPFIWDLYDGKGYNIAAFDNKYAYTVKGRNDRNVEHLIITNY